MYIQTRSQVYDVSKQALIMGILNVTPDSFSDGGKYTTIDAAVARAKEMVASGAHIIDIGGESTRPDHQPITAQEEIARVVPVIEALQAEINVPISIDTYKAETAAAAIEAGAEMMNDIWGATYDPKMAKVAAKFDIPIVLMHNKTTKIYDDIIVDMITDLERSIAIAKAAGVRDENIILDPGIGFGKTLEDNFIVLQHLDRLTAHFKHPFLLATSRKSFITKVLDQASDQRDNATGATTCFGMTKGARLFRVHDVPRTKELIAMMEAMMQGGVDHR